MYHSTYMHMYTCSNTPSPVRSLSPEAFHNATYYLYVISFQYVVFSLFSMILRRVIFCEIVRFVFFSFFPKNFEYSLRYLISESIISHIPSFTSFFFHCFICETFGCSIISNYRSFSLYVA